MTITSADPHHFIPPDTPARAYIDPGPTAAVHLTLGGRLVLTLDWGSNTKAGALAQLAEWTAAVEALPDDPEPLPLMVAAALDPHEAGPYCAAFGCDPMPAPTEIVTAP